MSDFHKKWKEFLAEGRRKKGAAVQWPPQELVDQNLLSQHPEGEPETLESAESDIEPEHRSAYKDLPWLLRRKVDREMDKYRASYALDPDGDFARHGAGAQVHIQDLVDREGISEKEATERYKEDILPGLEEVFEDEPHWMPNKKDHPDDPMARLDAPAHYSPGTKTTHIGRPGNPTMIDAYGPSYGYLLNHELGHALDFEFGPPNPDPRRSQTQSYRQKDKFDLAFPEYPTRERSEIYSDLIGLRAELNDMWKKGRRKTPHLTTMDLKMIEKGFSPANMRGPLRAVHGVLFGSPGSYRLPEMLKDFRNSDLSDQEIVDILNSIALSTPEEPATPSPTTSQTRFAESQNKGFHDKWRQFLREEEEFQKNVVRPRLKRNRSALIDSGAHDHNGGGPSGAKPRPRGDLPHDAGPLKEGLRPRLLREISEDEVEHIRAAIDEMGPEELAFNDAFQGRTRRVIDFPAIDIDSDLGKFMEFFRKQEYEVDWKRGVVSAERDITSSEDLLDDLMAPRLGRDQSRQKRSKKIQMKVGKLFAKIAELSKKHGVLFQKVVDNLKAAGVTPRSPGNLSGTALEDALPDEQERGRYEQLYSQLRLYIPNPGYFEPSWSETPDWATKMAKYWQENAGYIKKEIDELKGDQYSIILTRDPIDILRMSDFNNITSCHSPPSRTGGESYYKCAVAEAHGHGAIAYVVNTQDLLEATETDSIEAAEAAIDRDQVGEIFPDDTRGSHIGLSTELNPISRVRLRKFVYDTPDPEGGYDIGTQLAVPEKRVYGKKIPGFVDRVVQWARENQKEALENMPVDAYGDGIDLGKFKLIGASYEDTQGYAGRRQLMVQLTGRPNEDFDGQVEQDASPEYDLDTSMFTAGQIEAAQARVDEIVDEWNNRYQAAEIEASVEDDDGQVIIMLKAWMKVQWGVEEWSKLPASTSARWAVSELNDLGWAWADESAAWLRREGDPRFNNTQAITLGFRIEPENIPDWTGMPFTADPEEVEDFGVAVNAIDDKYDGIKHYLTRHYKMEGSMVGGRFLNMAIEISNNDIDPYEWTLELDDRWDPEEATIIVGQVEFFFDADELQWNPQVLQQVLDSRDFKLAIRKKMLADAKEEVQTEYNIDIYDQGTGAVPLDNGVNYEFAFVVGDEDPDEVIDLFEAAVWQPGTVDDEDKLREIFLSTLETIRRLRMPSGMQGREPIEQLWDDESEARYQALVQKSDPPSAQNSEDENLTESRLNESRDTHRMYKKWRSFLK